MPAAAPTKAEPKLAATTSGSQPNQSLIDGLACLETLAIAGEAVGTRDLARRMGIHHVRANRLLKSLAEAGFAEQDAQRRYRPGPGFHVLAVLAMHGSGLIRRALPHLQTLAHDTNATVALGMLWRSQVCYLFHGDAATPTADALGRTRLVAAADSSIGHVLLAAQPDATATDTVTASALKTVRKHGYACLEHPDPSGSHHSIAVTVGQPIFAGIAVTNLPTTAPITPIVAKLRATADAIAKDHP